MVSPIGIGLKEFNVKSEKERIRRYRRYVCEAGAVNRPEKGKTKVIGDRILEKERNREFELSRSDRFRYRTRYFTDSGVIGSKNLFQRPICASNITLIQKMKKNQNL